ncbi:MAG: transposase [Anaerolineae bacterium]|nr:transposase [Anaerolineae bacterium]
MLPAQHREAWQPHWRRLLQQVAAAIPADWFVLVLADRGLYARWLYRAIQQVGWHPFLRINAQGCFRFPNGSYQPLRNLVPQPGVFWKGHVICFKDRPLDCTLLVAWKEGYEPWLIVTDLAPVVAETAWYGLRVWIEGGFKDLKRGGWQWQQTRITDPERAERFWLTLALATLWVVSVGGEAEMTQAVSGLEHLPETHIARRRASRRSRPRLLSCFRRGIQMILVAVLIGRPLPLGRFYADPWPTFALSPCGP